MLNALKVIALTPHIRAYLLANDPKALEQVERAIAYAEEMKGYNPPPRNTGPHAFKASQFRSETCSVCGKYRWWLGHLEQ